MPRHTPIALALSCVGCLAPHGMAPLPLPLGKEAVFGEATAGYGVASGRSAARSELGLGAHYADWGALELRGEYVHVEEQEGTDQRGEVASRSLNAFQPYLRPAFFAGPFTFVVPFSGFAAGAGGGGVVAGLMGTAVGVGGPSWNVFAGAQWQGSELVGGTSTTSSAREVCFGARYALSGSFWRVSLDPQLVASAHRYETHTDGNVPSSFVSERDFILLMMQVSVALGQLSPSRAGQSQHPQPQPQRTPRPRVPASAAPPSACAELCRAQARIVCGIPRLSCERACEAKQVPPECVAARAALLRCEASAPRCDGHHVVFPACAPLRQELETCLSSPPGAQDCASPGGCTPQAPPRRLDRTKSLGDAPE